MLPALARKSGEIDERSVVNITVLGHASPELKSYLDEGVSTSAYRYVFDDSIDELIQRGERAPYVIVASPSAVRGLGIAFEVFAARSANAEAIGVILDQAGALDDDELDRVEMTIREHLAEMNLDADALPVLRTHAGMAPFNREQWAHHTAEIFVMLDERSRPRDLPPQPFVITRHGITAPRIDLHVRLQHDRLREAVAGARGASMEILPMHTSHLAHPVHDTSDLHGIISGKVVRGRVCVGDEIDVLWAARRPARRTLRSLLRFDGEGMREANVGAWVICVPDADLDASITLPPLGVVAAGSLRRVRGFTCTVHNAWNPTSGEVARPYQKGDRLMVMTPPFGFGGHQATVRSVVNDATQQKLSIKFSYAAWVDTCTSLIVRHKLGTLAFDVVFEDIGNDAG